MANHYHSKLEYCVTGRFLHSPAPLHLSFPYTLFPTHPLPYSLLRCYSIPLISYSHSSAPPLTYSSSLLLLISPLLHSLIPYLPYSLFLCSSILQLPCSLISILTSKRCIKGVKCSRRVYFQHGSDIIPDNRNLHFVPPLSTRAAG